MHRHLLEIRGCVRAVRPGARVLVGLGAILLGMITSQGQARMPGPNLPAGEVGACCVEDPPVCY